MNCRPHPVRHFQNARLLAAVPVLIIVMAGSGLALANGDKLKPQQRFIEVDREIQAVKQEVLEINREILLLEELLLYPQDQQLVVFVSLTGNSLVNVNSISLELDGTTLSRHVYTRSEEAALHKGGIHRLYVGRLRDGAHVMDVALSVSGTNGQQVQRRQSVKFIKGSGRKVMELSIAAGDERPEPEVSVHEW